MPIIYRPSARLQSCNTSHETASGSNDVCASRPGPRNCYRREIWNKNTYTFGNRRVAPTLPGVWGATIPLESLKPYHHIQHHGPTSRGDHWDGKTATSFHSISGWRLDSSLRGLAHPLGCVLRCAYLARF